MVEFHGIPHVEFGFLVASLCIDELRMLNVNNNVVKSVSQAPDEKIRKQEENDAEAEVKN